MIWAIIRKDLKEILSRPKIWLPMILVPLILTVVQPAIFILSISHSKPKASGMDELLKRVASTYLFQNEIQKHLCVVIDYLFPCLFLIVPVLTASIIAANSFAGEKERKTLESVLYTPITLKQLFYAKILGTFIPAFAVTFLAFLGFTCTVRLLASSYVSLIGFPNLRWIVLLFSLCPALIMLALTFSIWISARCSTFQEAQQMGGFIVIPIIGIIIAQFSGWFLLEIPQMIFLTVLVIILDYFLISLVSRTFTYEKLLQ